MSESEILQAIRLEMGKMNDVLIFRNSVGGLYDKNGRFVRYGLGVGSSDLIGLFRGRFLAIEVKRPGGKRSPEQINFIEVIRRAGGLAGFAESVEQAQAILNGN